MAARSGERVRLCRVNGCLHKNTRFQNKEERPEDGEVFRAL